MQDYEKLGVFYLGRDYDLGAKQAQDGLLLYDSRDLVTHAVVVGMTGSGKTGLCIDLIEEAAIDGIPSILIDPKGDLANLLLTFPQLRGEDFAPWVNPDDAARNALSALSPAVSQHGAQLCDFCALAFAWKLGAAGRWCSCKKPVLNACHPAVPRAHFSQALKRINKELADLSEC